MFYNDCDCEKIVKRVNEYCKSHPYYGKISEKLTIKSLVEIMENVKGIYSFKQSKYFYLADDGTLCIIHDVSVNDVINISKKCKNGEYWEEYINIDKYKYSVVGMNDAKRKNIIAKLSREIFSDEAVVTDCIDIVIRQQF